MFRLIATLAVAGVVAACAQPGPTGPMSAKPMPPAGGPMAPGPMAAPAAPPPPPVTPPAAQVFRQAPLPYAADALEPVIDKATMEIHHGRHHKAYYDALNNAAASSPEVARSSVEQLVATASRQTLVVRNNAGGAWNHAFFWNIMAPVGQGGAPSPALMARVQADFGSMDNLMRQFNQAGASRFGSGWAWLIVRDGKLAVTSTPNQDNPLMDLAEVRGTPILGNDVWEHAYYLKYQNRRADYLAAWWQVVNWNEVNRRFAASAAAGPATAR
jgi:Fe-Mn family superoxide dismutase